jgi:hypothetical protein
MTMFFPHFVGDAQDVWPDGRWHSLEQNLTKNAGLIQVKPRGVG